MTEIDRLLIQLRDCFTAGYTMPQFCIDNEIKKPLIVGVDKTQQNFLWELYVQFKYDKRISADFAFIKGETTTLTLVTDNNTIPPLTIENVSELDTSIYDKIIILSHAGLPNSNVIYLRELFNVFRRHVYYEIPLYHFAEKHPDVKIIVHNLPDNPLVYEGGEKFDESLLTLPQVRELVDRIKESPLKHIPTPLDNLGYSNEEVLELVTFKRRAKVNFDGSTSMYDAGPPTNVINGKRMTAYQPKAYKNRIYFFGACMHFGAYAPYDKTIESYLQKFLNEKNLPYRVENESQPISQRRQDLFYNLNNLITEPNDIIFVHGYESVNGFPFYDIRHALLPPYDYRKAYFCKGHLNEIGYKAVAEKIFELLIKYDFFKNNDFAYPPPPTYSSSLWYTSRKFFFSTKFFSKQRAGGVQEKTSRKKISGRRDCHELQPLHSRTRIFD